MPVITRSNSKLDTFQVNPDTGIITFETRKVLAMTSNGDTTPAPPVEVTNEQLNASLQTVLAVVTENNVSMAALTGDVQTIKLDITSIKDVTNESEGIKEQLYSTQGKVARLELKNLKLEEQILSLESTHYSKDLMFYNVDDENNESEQQLKNTIYDIIEHTMNVPSIMVFNRHNPAGDVRIDTATRLGRYRDDKSRPVLVTFLSKSGRNIVYSKPHTSKLKDDIKIRISEHFPTIIKERRQTQIAHLKQLRDSNSETTNRISLNKDKIFINGIERDTFAFQRNLLSSTTPISINFDKLKHSEKIVEKRSTFQAHSLKVQTLDQAAAARNAIYQNPQLAMATHIMYAYRIGDTRDSMETGFSDDDEVGGGSILMELLEKHKLSNVFICVTRIKKGFNIGSIRFKCIEKCAKELLLKAEPEETEEIEEAENLPVFNQLCFN